jgi:hypothetical protein
MPHSAKTGPRWNHWRFFAVLESAVGSALDRPVRLVAACHPPKRGSVALQNLAPRQQLATYTRGQKRPQVAREERSFWVALSRVWSGWQSVLVVVKPATVVLATVVVRRRMLEEIDEDKTWRL